MPEIFDYIIVGAGSAGCVLANRLSENPNTRVLILEAGPMDRDWLIHIPFGIGKMYPERRHDWGYDHEPSPEVNGRVIDAMRGKVVGGSSSTNAMAYVRGHAGDYDRWAQKGATGWSYDEVLPYFIRNECWTESDDPKYRGRSGPLTVESARDRDPIYDAWSQAIEKAGYPLRADYNAEEQEGFSRIQFTIRNGKRCSAAVAFLKPALSRKNLQLRTEALGSRILFEGNRAVGIEYIQGNETKTAMANREVILSGGVFNSPHLLMLSGIGPAEQLRAHGIDVKLDLPGVGSNLQDHLIGLVTFKRKAQSQFLRSMRFDRMATAMMQAYFFGTGPATLLPVGLVGFVKTNPELAVPDLQMIMRGTLPAVHLWFPGIKQPFLDGFCIRPVLLHPETRSHIALRSKDPRDMVKVFQRFLTDEKDRATLRESVRIARRITVQAPMDQHRGEELDPGVSVQSDDELDDFLRRNVITAHHPIGTCAMGIGPSAVLDPKMRVRGVEALRVVDGSAMPDLPSGNTNAPVMMMAAKAADFILEANRASVGRAA